MSVTALWQDIQTVAAVELASLREENVELRGQPVFRFAHDRHQHGSDEG